MWRKIAKNIGKTLIKERQLGFGSTNTAKQIADMEQRTESSSKSIIAKVRNHLYIGTSDLDKVYSIQKHNVETLKVIKGEVEKFDTFEDEYIAGLRKIARQKEQFLQNFLNRIIEDFRNAEAEARLTAQAAGLERIKSTAIFLGMVPVGAALGVVKTGVLVPKVILKTIDNFFSQTHLGTGIIMAQIAKDTGVNPDPAIQQALDQDLVSLRKRWDELRVRIAAQKDEYKVNDQEIINFFKAFMDFSLKLQAVSIHLKKPMFNGEERAEYKEIKMRELSQILAILSQHLNNVNILNQFSFEKGFNPYRVVKRVKNIIDTKEEAQNS